jgi:hypothetical protein
MFVSGPILTLLLDGAKKSLMHFRPAMGFWIRMVIGR